MSALPDPGYRDMADFPHTFNHAYEAGYMEGFAAGMASERDAIAKRLAEDVARRDAQPAPPAHEHTSWISLKTNRRLKTDAGRL